MTEHGRLETAVQAGTYFALMPGPELSEDVPFLTNKYRRACDLLKARLDIRLGWTTVPLRATHCHAVGRSLIRLNIAFCTTFIYS